MKKPLSHLTQEAGHFTDPPRRSSKATDPSGNAYRTLLAISELDQKELMNPSDDMSSQVQALQQALSLFRLKS